MNKVIAVLLIKVDDNFRICFGIELVPAFGELLSKLRIIEDLPIVAYPD